MDNNIYSIATRTPLLALGIQSTPGGMEGRKQLLEPYVGLPGFFLDLFPGP